MPIEQNGRSRVSWPVFISVCTLVLAMLVVGVNILWAQLNDKFTSQREIFDLKLENNTLKTQLSQEKIQTAILRSKTMSDIDGGKHYEK